MYSEEASLFGISFLDATVVAKETYYNSSCYNIIYSRYLTFKFRGSIKNILWSSSIKLEEEHFQLLGEE